MKAEQTEQTEVVEVEVEEVEEVEEVAEKLTVAEIMHKMTKEAIRLYDDPIPQGLRGEPIRKLLLHWFCKLPHRPAYMYLDVLRRKYDLSVETMGDALCRLATLNDVDSEVVVDVDGADISTAESAAKFIRDTLSLRLSGEQLPAVGKVSIRDKRLRKSKGKGKSQIVNLAELDYI